MPGGAGGGPISFSALFKRSNIRPILFCSVAVLGAVLYGYDGTYFTGVLAMETFERDFGEIGSDGQPFLPSGRQSLLTSIIQAGEVVGALSAGFIGDFGGRRITIAVACLAMIVGVILQVVTTSSVAIFTVGRLILGIGVGITSNAVPLYLSEIPPTAIRGPVVSSWQLFLAIGQVIGACIGQGTRNIPNSASYRIPVVANLGIILPLLIGVFLIPESPRWLIQKNRDEKAERALIRINKSQPDPDHVVRTEMELFRRSKREEEEAAESGQGWMSILKGTQRRRLICAVGILVAQQISGVQFIFSYSTVFLTSVGVGSPFLITIVVTIIEVIGVLASFLVVNRYGRRPLLLWTSLLMTVALLICGVLGTIDYANNESARNGIAAMIMIYVFFFNVAFGPLAWVIATELSVGQNRNKIMSVATTCFWVTAFIVTFTLPYLYNPDEGNLGPKIGYLYMGGSIIAMAFIYFYIPETLGRSLEDINFMMEAKVPTLQWKGFDTGLDREAMEALAAAGGKKGARPDPEDVKHIEHGESSTAPGTKTAKQLEQGQ